MKTVWGIFPYFVVVADQDHGTTNGPIVRHPPNVTRATVEHEIIHVKQWYVLTGLFLASTFAADYSGNFLICVPFAAFYIYMMLSKTGRYIRETAAFGASLREAPEGLFAHYLGHYVRVLNTSKYNVDMPERAIRDRILRRYEDKRIF